MFNHWRLDRRKRKTETALFVDRQPNKKRVFHTFSAFSRLNNFAFLLQSGKEIADWFTLIRICWGRLWLFYLETRKHFLQLFLHDLFRWQEPHGHDCCQVARVSITIYTICITTRGQWFQLSANFEDAQKSLKSCYRLCHNKAGLLFYISNAHHSLN